ncbi:MAG: hypothetical protein MSG78_11060 [Clostridiales bacterium]|nr:hypothetical protein [Clostridiales bacterium]
MWLFKKKADKELERVFWELQMNLENNYKDLAIAAYREAEQLMEQKKKSNDLSQKEYKKYKRQLAEYSKKMEHYNHTNVSNFLKERY